MLNLPNHVIPLQTHLNVMEPVLILIRLTMRLINKHPQRNKIRIISNEELIRININQIQLRIIKPARSTNKIYLTITIIQMNNQNIPSRVQITRDCLADRIVTLVPNRT